MISAGVVPQGIVPKTINGLPFHPLVVHATVVDLPLASLAVLLAGCWPAARRYLKIGPLLLSVLALVLLPISYASGDNLKDRVGDGPLIQRHEHLAHQLLWPVIGLVVAAVVIELTRQLDDPDGHRYRVAASGRARADTGALALAVLAAVLAVVFAVWTTVQTARVGEAGARSVWGSHDSSSRQLIPLASHEFMMHTE